MPNIWMINIKILMSSTVTEREYFDPVARGNRQEHTSDHR